MSVPALPGDEYEPTRRLPDCEPGLPPQRWSSGVRRRNLRLVPPPEPALRPRTPPPALVRVLRQVLEALDGRRPVEQLRPLMSRNARHDLLARLRDVGRGGQHTLRSIHTCRPAADVLEVSVMIDYRPPVGPPRVVAAATRFERDGARWRCMVLVLL